jgi:hypothetical protein
MEKLAGQMKENEKDSVKHNNVLEPSKLEN